MSKQEGFKKEEAFAKVGRRVRLRMGSNECGRVVQSVLYSNSSGDPEWCVVVELDSGETEAPITRSAYSLMIQET